MSDHGVTVEVYGHLWSGPRAVYSYSSDVIPADAAAVKRIAGDFADIIDYRVVEWMHRYESTSHPPITRRIDEYHTRRGFRNGMTPQRFYRLANR